MAYQHQGMASIGNLLTHQNTSISSDVVVVGNFD
jgi:hypothetical protein